MVVMKRCLLVICCLFVNVCHAMLKDNWVSESVKLDKSSCRIAQQDLSKMIGKVVIYKQKDPFYATGILGDNHIKTDLYVVYVNESKTKGVLRPAKELYYADNT